MTDNHTDTYLLHSQIGQAIDSNDPAVTPEQRQWHTKLLDNWYLNACNGFTGLSPHDILCQTMALLHTDLFYYEAENEPRFRQSLISRLFNL